MEPDHTTTEPSPPGAGGDGLGLERLVFFSDAVLAVVITITVLELKPPVGRTFAALGYLWPNVVSYAVSYLFIAIIWVNHHHLMRLVRGCTPRLIWLNFAHLFLVSLLPFATEWAANTRLAPAAMVVYAAVFVGVDFAYLIFEREVLAQADLSRVPPAARRQARRRALTTLAIFASAGPAALFEPWLGLALICVALSFFVRPEVRAMQMARRSPDRQA